MVQEDLLTDNLRQKLGLEPAQDLVCNNSPVLSDVLKEPEWATLANQVEARCKLVPKLQTHQQLLEYANKHDL